MLSLLIYLIFLAVFSGLIIKHPFFQAPSFRRSPLLAVLLLKVGAGFALWYIYSNYYPDRNLADTFKYFDDSQHLFASFGQDPAAFFSMLTGIPFTDADLHVYYDQMNNWYTPDEQYLYNDNRTIIRVNALLWFVSFGNYHVHALFFSFLSIVGLQFMYKAFLPHSPYPKLSFLVTFLFPSVIFWSSGVMKEGLLLFALGGFIYLLNCLRPNEWKQKKFLLFPVFLLILIALKYYIILALIPAIPVFLLIRFNILKKAFRAYLISYSVCIFLGLLVGKIMPYHDIVDTITKKQLDFYGLAESMNSGSLIQTRRLDYTFPTLLSNVPEAFVNATFRPSLIDLWKFRSPLIILSALENTIWTLLLICPLIGFMYPRKADNLFWFILFFSATILTLSGLVTPVLGALVRYKVPLIPLIANSCLLMINFERIQKRLIPKRYHSWIKKLL